MDDYTIKMKGYLVVLPDILSIAHSVIVGIDLLGCTENALVDSRRQLFHQTGSPRHNCTSVDSPFADCQTHQRSGFDKSARARKTKLFHGIRNSECLKKRDYYGRIIVLNTLFEGKQIDIDKILSEFRPFDIS
jgi:hypothetical protein